MLYLQQVFWNWILSPPKKRVRINGNGNSVVTWQSQTISHKSFAPLAEIFGVTYSIGIKTKRIKKIVPDFVNKYLTPAGLAFWFLDDGGKLSYGKSERKGTCLNTHNFSIEEVEELCKGLNQKFGLQCWPKENKKKWQIAIGGKSHDLFLNTINPWLIPEMKTLKWPVPYRKGIKSEICWK